MLVRLLGKDAEAREGEWDIPFADVEDWARPYLGYAYANGLTKGTGDTTFGGAALTDERQYVTFLLRALGYSEAESDFTFSEALDFATQIGLLEARETEEPFDRGDLVSDSYLALCTALKAEERTLSNKLLWDDVFTTLQLRDTYDGKLLVAADMPDIMETTDEKAVRAETEQELLDLTLLLAKNVQFALCVRVPTNTHEEKLEFQKLRSVLSEDTQLNELVDPDYEHRYPNGGIKVRFSSNWPSEDVFYVTCGIEMDQILETYYSDPARLSKNRAFHSHLMDGVNYEESILSIYHGSYEAVELLVNKIDEIIEENITENMTERQKAAALNTYLCDHVEYSMLSKAGTAHGDFRNVRYHIEDALFDGTAICFGYSMAYKALCNAAGLECNYVGGYSSDDPDPINQHGWNQVKIDEKWYNVDVTWNDVPGGRVKYLFKSDAYMRANKHYGGAYFPDLSADFKGLIHDCPDNL